MDSFASLAGLYEAYLMEARVAKLQICRDSTCSFPTNPHLLVNAVDVPLHRDNATAISYAWGEFDRQKRTVGHTFQPEKHVQLELGTEWIISDVVDRLAELSEEKPIWMDQLCIPQQEDKILKTLADIPSIFCTLDVVVLLPGSLCGCIPKLVEEINRLPSDHRGHKAEMQAVKRADRCLSTGVSSWPRRMWTHNELMHSKRVRCVWASKIENPCVSLHDPDANGENLPPFQRQMFEMLTKTGLSQGLAMRHVYVYMEATKVAMCRDLFYYSRTEDRPYGGQVFERFYRFLLGERFKKPPNVRFLRAEGGPMADFLVRLSGEATGNSGSFRLRREATRSRDYIISLWTACPDYIVPNTYKSMSVAGLMQDALDQLQRNHQITLAVTAPQGLFDAGSFGSAIWNPLEYLSAIDPTCDADLYRALGGAMAVPVISGLRNYVPIVLDDAAQPSLSTSAMDYETLLYHLNDLFSFENEVSGYRTNINAARMVIKLLHQIMHHWVDCSAKAVDDLCTEMAQKWHSNPFSKEKAQIRSAKAQWFRRIYPIKDYIRFLCNHRMTKAFHEEYSPELDSLLYSNEPEQIHDEVYNVVYNVVAAALELDLEYCERKNVKLIFSISSDEQQLPRVGFCRGDVDIDEIASERRKAITISFGGTKSRPSKLLYEAVQIMNVDFHNKGEGAEDISIAPCYQVFAVWVPIAAVFDEKCGAYAYWPWSASQGANCGLLL